MRLKALSCTVWLFKSYFTGVIKRQVVQRDVTMNVLALKNQSDLWGELFTEYNKKHQSQHRSTICSSISI